MALVTAEFCRTFLPELTGTGEDVLLASLIDQVEGAIAEHCGYPPASAGSQATLEDVTYTHILDGDLEDEVLRLPVTPVQSITSIHISGLQEWDAESLLEATDYVVDGVTGRVTLSPTGTQASWGTAPQSVRVVYVAGYTAAPAALKRLIALGVKQAWTQRHTFNQQSASLGQGSMSLRSDEVLPTSMHAALSPYRLPGCWL